MTPHELIIRWLIAFTITQAVECPIYVRFFRVGWFTAFAASAITHPIVCFVIPKVWEASYLAFVTAHPARQLSDAAYFVAYGLIAETFAIVVEWLWLRWRMKLAWRRALVASFVANVASSAVGGLASWLTGFP